MDAGEFERRTLRALDGHRNELQVMEDTIMASVQTKTPIPNLKDIFKEFAEAARECAGALEFYGENGPLPGEVRIAMLGVQEAIDDCASALVLAGEVPEASE